MKQETLKILYIDVETTGTNPQDHDIIQLAMIIEINGEVVKEVDMKMKPTNFETIENAALEVTGTTREMLRKYPDPKKQFIRLESILNSYIDKYDKNDKAYPVGYNVDFDLQFLKEFFDKNNSPYLGSYINWRKVDPLYILYMMDIQGRAWLPDYKLETVCKDRGIELQAHNALSDIRATRQLLHQLLNNEERARTKN